MLVLVVVPVLAPPGSGPLKEKRTEEKKRKRYATELIFPMDSQTRIIHQPLDQAKANLTARVIVEGGGEKKQVWWKVPAFIGQPPRGCVPAPWRR